MSQPSAQPRPHDEISGALLDAESHMLELIGQGASLEQVLGVLCQVAERHLDAAALTSVLLLEGDRLRHGAAPSLPAPYNQAIDGLKIGHGVGSCGTAAFTREPVIVSDIASDPFWKDFAALAGQHGLRACWSMPISGTHQKVLGTFAIYHRHPRAPTAEDLRLIQRLALISRVAIEHTRAERERAALIDEARKAQQRAEEERSKLRDFVMSAPAMLCMLRGPDHVYELANPLYLRGLQGRDVTGKPLLESLPEMKDHPLLTQLDRVYRTGEPYFGNEVLLEGPDEQGVHRRAWFNFVYQPTRDSAGKVSGIAVYASDVTELVEGRNRISAALDAEKQARAQLEQTEAQFRSFFDAMPQLAWTARPDGEVDFFNRGWFEYTGTSPEQMKDGRWDRVHDPAVLPKVVERWNHSLATGTDFEMEFPLRRHDGSFRIFLTRARPLRDAQGKIIRWVGINTDVDDIRAAHALSEEMAVQNRATEELLTRLMNEKAEVERRLAELTDRRSA